MGGPARMSQKILIYQILVSFFMVYMDDYPENPENI